MTAFNTQLGRKAVVALGASRDWASEVKACILFADHMICEDPFLNCLRIYGTFTSNQLYDWGAERLSSTTAAS